ncbi:DsbA family oxidoreductase [Ornithinimicrobium pratense]|uniref:DsbA family oxidoreductase n=1 Tax=Ornithinimicrobium pratense TaxID=2593973 RepID=A0A5J6V775_9MICO|nr:DsbA family oxidoreductase [Ornithinimicrobium pratense]QFG69910.1 DsbA family oxidoreductase [Ornithinimicrobium pratense]
MRIDVWSDLLCPFCHLGRRHLALALTEFEHADQVSVIWHSYQLDPDAPATLEGSNVQRLAEKYGVDRDQMVATQEQLAADAAEVGLDYRWEQTVGGNSYDAHRVIHLARFQGLEEAVTSRIMQAWFTEGRSIGDQDVLVELAADAGLDPEDVRGVLAQDSFGAEVRADIDLATRIGISAVPTFVLDQKFGVTGVQPVETMVGALRYAWADQGNTAGGGCGGNCGCGGGAPAEQVAPEPAAQGGCGSGACGCGGGAPAESAREPEPAAVGGCGSGTCGCR